MKRIIACMLAAVILCCLFGCEEKQPEQPELSEQIKSSEDISEDIRREPSEEAPDSGIPEGVDRTVTFDGISIAGKEVAVIGEGTVGIETSYLTAQSLVPDSGYIVKGKVNRVTYANRDGNAIMLYDVQLDEVWADRLHPEGQKLGAGDSITVFQSGGYLPGDIFEKYHRSGMNLTANQLVLQNIANIPFPEEEDEYVLFLTDYPETALAGVYMVTGVYQGRYEVEGETVCRFYPEGSSPYEDDAETLAELKAAVLDALKNSRPEQALTMESVLENYITQLRSVLESEKETLSRTGDDGTTDFITEVIEGHEKQLEEVPVFYKKVLDCADEIAAKAEMHPSVLLLDHASPEKVYGGNSFASGIIERAGAINAAKAYVSVIGEEASVTMDQIAEMDPDIIVIYSTVNKDYYTAEDVLACPELQTVSAVKNGSVYEADVIGPWFSAGEQNVEPYGWMGVAYLQTLLYPETYTGERFQEDAWEFLTLMGETEGYERRFCTG